MEQVSSPLVSVILPIKNGVNTIKRAVNSILNQSFKDFELIIIENGSTDDTYKYIRDNITDHRIRLHSLEKGNLVEALNFGLKESKGKFIARMDADDESHPERFIEQVNYLRKNKSCSLVATTVDFKSSLESHQGLQEYVNWQNKIVSDKDIFLKRFTESPIVHPSIMVKKGILKDLKGWRDGDFPEDYELWLRLMDQGHTISKINRPLLTWFDHKERLTRTDSRYSLQAFYVLKSKYLVRWLNQNVKNKNIYIWGRGRTSVRRSSLLKNLGIEIKGYIDIDPKKCAKPNTIHYTEINKLPDPFILSYVGKRGAKEFIYKHLSDENFIEGEDFLIVS